jgi:hypothetical protein
VALTPWETLLSLDIAVNKKDLWSASRVLNTKSMQLRWRTPWAQMPDVDRKSHLHFPHWTNSIWMNENM